jgi:hypothetical protein
MKGLDIGPKTMKFSEKKSGSQDSRLERPHGGIRDYQVRRRTFAIARMMAEITGKEP